MASIASVGNCFLLKEACIFTGDRFIENGHVLVVDGRIVDAAEGECLTVPPNTPVVSAKGQTVLPGLIDAHVHGLGGNPLCLEQSLRFGVTTVCDMHNDHKFIDVLNGLAQDPQQKGKYADFKCAGTGATIRGGWPEAVVLSHGRNLRAEAMIQGWPKLEHPSEAESFVQQQISRCGASYIKLMHEVGDSLREDINPPRPPLEIQQALVKAAHRHGLIAVGHAFSYAGAVDLLNCGVDGLTHIFLDQPPSDDYVSLALRAGAYLNPTLATCASQTSQGDEMQTNFAADPLAQKLLFDKSPRQALAMAGKHAKVEYAYASTTAMYKAGVPIIIGSDANGQPRGSSYGMGVHMELHLLVHKIGMKPIEALKGATSLTADRFGFHDRGRLAPGTKADLVMVRGDVRDVMADEKTLCLPLTAVWRDGILATVWAEEDAIHREA